MDLVPKPDQVVSAAGNVAHKVLYGGLADLRPMPRTLIDEGELREVYHYRPAATAREQGDPVLLDVSTSTTTNGLTGRLKGEGAVLGHPWLLDAAGQPTPDPAALFTDPPGSILPLGGLDSGHKGYALGLLVEALTAALGGFGRADASEGWGAAVFLQVIDPAAFGELGVELSRFEVAAA